MPGPTMTDAELRQWYDNFARELKEKVSIDVTLKADIGRIKNFPILRWNAEDWNTPQVGEPTYAYVPHDENGYTVPAPQDPTADEHIAWLKNNLNPEVNIGQIRELYNMSRAGTLMVTAPGKGPQQIQQVYTNAEGVITTSLPAAVYAPGSRVEIPEDKRMPVLPEKLDIPDPVRYNLPAMPQEPVRPQNMNPGFLSWLGYILGFNTDYAKMVQYQRDMESLPDRVEAWRNSLNEYDQTDVNNYQDAVARRNEYELALEVYRREPLAILRGISDGYQKNYQARVTADNQNGVANDKKYSTLVSSESSAMAEMHNETFAGKMEKAAAVVDGQMYLPERTLKAVNLLMGPKADPDKMEDWLKEGAYKKGNYKFTQYDMEEYSLPDDSDNIIEDEEVKQARKAEWDKENNELATWACFAALNDPDVAGKTLQPQSTKEQSAERRYTNILYNLFTVGRLKSDAEMGFVEPAREKGMAAFRAYRKENDPSQLIKLLGNCLRQLSREASSETVLEKDGFQNKLYLIKQVHQILNKNDWLKSTDLNEQELKDVDAHIALYEVVDAGREAQKRLVEHAKGTQTLNKEELVKAGQDILFAQLISARYEVVSREIDDVVDSSGKRLEAQGWIGRAHAIEINMKRQVDEAKANNDPDWEAHEQHWKLSMELLQKARCFIDIDDLRRPMNETSLQLLNTESVVKTKQQLIELYDLNKITTMDKESLAKIASSRFEFEKVFVAKDKQDIGSLMQQKSLQKEQVQADQGAVALADPNANVSVKI